MVLLRNVISRMALSPTKRRNRPGIAFGTGARQRSNLAAAKVLLDFWRVIHYLLVYLRGNVHPAPDADPASVESQWQARTIWIPAMDGKKLSHTAAAIRPRPLPRSSDSAVDIGNTPDPLIDRYGRKHTYLRLSVTDRCNLRCFYCMPPSGIPHKSQDQILRFEEITKLVQIFAGLGVRKVRLTGGEPLIRKNIETLAAAITAIKGIDTIGLTTNGILLPEHADSLKSAGLTRLNVSLDTLRPDRFTRLTHFDEYSRVRAGIDCALQAGFTPLRINVVVMRGFNDDELLDFVELARYNPFDVRFIEFMPFTANGWANDQFVSFAAMHQKIAERHSLQPVASGEGPPRVAKEFHLPGFCGTVGFITAISLPFCHECNRLRLSADGVLRSCLFSQTGISLRDAMRRGASAGTLTDLIRRLVEAKPLDHPNLDDLRNNRDHFIAEVGG